MFINPTINLSISFLIFLHHKYTAGRSVTAKCDCVEIHTISWCLLRFLVACYATLHPALSASLSQSDGWLVGPSHLTLFMFFILWPHCTCPNALVTSQMAPAHTHAIGVAVYPALFSCITVLTPSSDRTVKCKTFIAPTPLGKKSWNFQWILVTCDGFCMSKLRS